MSLTAVNFGRRRLRQRTAGALAVLAVFSVCVLASVQEKPAGTTKPRSHAASKRRAATYSKSSKRTRSAPRRRRPLSYRQRLARLRPAPERVTEIQRALIQAGYLREDANGKWDEPTRQAMLRFQTEHGFPTTGLPEAKSLMKLGLGPHPLPGDADPAAPARAGTDASTKPAASTPADPLPPRKEH
jgi:peptidoglycan hydrolase-like protein with peptidoglycan-binding domain